jgi:SAM-dependent methyltransferase
MNYFWDERYNQEEFVYGTEPNEFFKEQLNSLVPGKIIFVCEGEGRNAVYAAKLGWYVEAFDLSKVGMSKALKLAEKNNVNIHYQIADANVIEYPANQYDAVALIYAHFPSSIRSSIHQKVIKWLKPNGKVILEAFNPNQLNNSSGGPKDIDMLYTKEILINDFKDLKIDLLEYKQIFLSEGKFHHGIADVVRFVGTKIK